MKEKNKNLEKEFFDFISTEEMKPPIALDNYIKDTIQKKLQPKRSIVFLKLLVIHTLVSLFSLSICPQFEIQTFAIFDSMKVFMKLLGHTYCMILCGFLYLSISALIISLVLKPGEITLIRKDNYFLIAILAMASLGIFMCFNAQFFIIPTTLWFIGAFTGGFLSLELGWSIRSMRNQKTIPNTRH